MDAKASAMRSAIAESTTSDSSATETRRRASVRRSCPNFARLMDATSRTWLAAYAQPTISAGASMATLKPFISGGAVKPAIPGYSDMARLMTGCERQEAKLTRTRASTVEAWQSIGLTTIATLTRSHWMAAELHIALIHSTTFRFAAAVTSCSISAWRSNSCPPVRCGTAGGQVTTVLSSHSPFFSPTDVSLE